MAILDEIFSWYDTLIMPLPLGYQAAISLGLIIFLAISVFSFIKKGHWIFLAIIIIALPGTWPAVKNIGYVLWKIALGLLFRVQGV